MPLKLAFASFQLVCRYAPSFAALLPDVPAGAKSAVAWSVRSVALALCCHPKMALLVGMEAKLPLKPVLLTRVIGTGSSQSPTSARSVPPSDAVPVSASTPPAAPATGAVTSNVTRPPVDCVKLPPTDAPVPMAYVPELVSVPPLSATLPDSVPALLTSSPLSPDWRIALPDSAESAPFPPIDRLLPLPPSTHTP